ncbi:DUF6240 domain-containing protein [Agathobacter rectalis]|jgi:hypothetical protein|uniref:Flagellar hook-length control protein FliK n=1 Tax=Agathobacter rectalis TaxID=39491 RepID=A0A396FGX5_9FIRM|nr:DUF6240 domain-containing protein [Agathobacter rectalis]RGZ17427.1 hypothetical protein DXA03_10200 [Agathobacter rectalis]RHA06151.1 hypothetical protein DW951_03265 [Agathobacter rectalis]RHA14324.1 hypothetical protein DW948_06465 [Agathobacter rectalis]RHL80753.1 hypothetical protein DW001_06105 [Agathobacter rectalis]
MQIENLINKSTDTKNTDTKTINDMTAGMRVSDYIKTDSSDNMSKKAAVVGSSNSVDMSDTIYARPQAKNEAGNNDGTDMAENLLNDMNQTSENRRNDMIVTASTTTSDDYKAAKDDGYDVIVTETDKIKAVLAKAGVDISIYGDDLSREQLTDITGSQTEAAMLVNQMKAYDIPATDDNIKAGTDAIDRAKSITNISNETKAYLVRNNMNPTVSNVYKATYSSSQVQNYKQKVGITDNVKQLYEELKPQLKQILEEAHIDSSDENLNQCRWLIDEDIAVTPDNVLLANQIDGITAAGENVSSDFYARAVTEALAMGKKAADATMSQDGLTFDMAREVCDVLSEATAEDIVTLESDNMPVTIENLSKLIAARGKDGAASQASANKALDNQITDSREARLVTAQRKLEEARLSMTAEANLSLIKKGVSIDTEPIERVVELLKQQENKYYGALFGESSVEASDDRVRMYNNVCDIFNQMKQQPAYVLTLESSDDTVYELYTAGKAMKQSLEAASGYETLMTSPRADMGDSISKAFQNVDDILKELQIETSESNRRAVRILAYNSTNITEENIKQIKSIDEQVQRAFSDMTPAVTLEMIKRGISPLDMSMSDISDTARQIKSENHDERDEKFSEFLWKLEKKNEISEEERDSYIGIYRLISQVEQSDGAVIGSLVNQGADITMKNLLTAVRVRGKSAMDYKVDDTFAGVDSVSRGIKIDSQIESAYQANCLRDVLDTLSPEKMEFVQDDSWLEMTPEQLRQAVYEADEDNTLSEQYATEQLRQFNQAVSVPENVYAFLEKYDVKTTAVNLMAASRLMKNPSEAVRNLWERGDSATARALLDETLRRFSESVKNPKELAQAQETLADTAEHVMDSMIIEDRHTGSIDIRQMKLLCSQLRIASNMSRQENYIVPIETADGVTGMKLRIVRGEDKKGLVDIFLEDKKCGRVAAYFEAKENSVSAMIVTDDEQTKKLFEDNITMFEAGISDGEQRVRIDVALEHDISAKESKMSDMKSNTESDNETKKQLDGGESVQTTRLYHIAEQFIVNVQRVIAQDSL